MHYLFLKYSPAVLSLPKLKDSHNTAKYSQWRSYKYNFIKKSSKHICFSREAWFALNMDDRDLRFEFNFDSNYEVNLICWLQESTNELDFDRDKA